MKNSLCKIIACLVFLPLVLLACVLILLTIPSVQQKVTCAAARMISDKTGIEVSVGHFSVRPPFNILLENVFAGDAQGDTLAYVGSLDMRLRIDALPDSLEVKTLEIENLVAHTANLIPSVKIDGRVGLLSVNVGSFDFNNMSFSVTNASLDDADVVLSLTDSDSDNEEDDASTSDTAGIGPVINVGDIILRNVNFAIEPLGLKLNVDKVGTSTLADVGGECYTVRSIDIADARFAYGDFELAIDNFSADAVVDLHNSIIASNRLMAKVSSLQAEADLHETRFDLEEMLVKTKGTGRFEETPLSLNAEYDIDDELFKAKLEFGSANLAEILQMSGNELIVAGCINASGSGINPMDRKMKADVEVCLDSCRWNSVNVSGINLSANLNSGTINGSISAPVSCRDSSMSAQFKFDSRFSVSNFMDRYMGIDLNACLTDAQACITSDTLASDSMNIGFRTDKEECSAVINMPGFFARAYVPAHVLEIPSLVPSFHDGPYSLPELDSLIASIPDIDADLEMTQNNPFCGLLQKRGFNLNEFTASLKSSGKSRKLDAILRTPDLDGVYRLPAINAGLTANLSDKKLNAELVLDTRVKDGVMSVRGIDTDADLRAVLLRDGDNIVADGNLMLDNLVYDGKDIGEMDVVFNIVPDSDNARHFVVNANLDSIPVGLARQFAPIPDSISMQGYVNARAAVSGLPDETSLFAGVKPVGITMEYLPYDVMLSLGNQEITLEDNQVELNGLSIIGADNTSLILDGGLDLNTMLLDVRVISDNFEPVKLPKDGPIPVYGQLFTGLDGVISGPVDSLLANIDVSILPQTDITYPIDRKNLAQVNPYGTVNVKFNPSSGLFLAGRVNVDKGELFYSPKLYPMMPFQIDQGSYIRFNGGVGDMEFAVSASQGAKAMYKPVGQVSRNVDFITGVKVGGSLKNIDIGFYLEAPKDLEIQKELSEMPQEDREGLSAILLATGMYASDSNEAAQMEGYALSSIVQSKLNAAVSNKLGDKLVLDFGVAKGEHGKGIKTTDYTLNVSKNFFNDMVNVKVGGSVSDNAEVNKNSDSFINNLSAEFKLDSIGALRARLFSMKDYYNIVEGELVKSGAGILYNKTIDHERDSLDRSLDLEIEANLVERSNNQLGPDAAVSLSKTNVFSRGDVLTARLKGAYYWDLNRKQLKDPSRNDTYLYGADLSLAFPYLQLGEKALKYIGQTTYSLGYLKEYISGDYGMHKLYGGVNYSLNQTKYITHSFSPLYLSVVFANEKSDELSQNLELEDLLNLFVNNEFIPSMKYSFSYNNYRDKNRVVNTALDFQVKESANLISGIMAACGRDFNQRYKKLLGIEYNQFVKFQLELRNKFRLGEKMELAARAIAGSVFCFGNSVGAPVSEAFSVGGPNSIRAFSPRSIGPGDFYNNNYSLQVFHSGDLKLEANVELRFPIAWKLYGAFFVDAGNVWNQMDPKEYMTDADIDALLSAFNLTQMYNCNLNADTFLNQIALGTGTGIRLDYESIVIRLDLGVAIHAPYDTGRSGYYNIPNFWRDGLRLNFGIGYPF